MGTIGKVPALLQTARPTALVITHMQEGYAPWSRAAIAGCRKLAEHAKPNRQGHPNQTGQVYTVEVYGEDERDFDERLNVPLMDILGFGQFTRIYQSEDDGTTQHLPEDLPYQRFILTGGSFKHPNSKGECQLWTFKALLDHLVKSSVLGKEDRPVELHFVADSLYLGLAKLDTATAPFTPESLDFYLTEARARGLSYDYYFNGQLLRHEENPVLAIFFWESAEQLLSILPAIEE